MSAATAWYDAERVKQPGSVILQRWVEERGAGPRIAAENHTTNQLTLQEIAKLYDIPTNSTGMPTVTESSAMRLSAVYACVALIAGCIASLPLPVYRRDGESRETADHPYWWLLNESPSGEMSAAAFWEYVVTAMLLYGDGFARIKRPSFSSPTVTGLVALHPERVEPYRDDSGEVRYRITTDKGTRYVLNAADVLHFPTVGFDGLTSIPPMRYAARGAVQLGLAAEQFSVNFFANGARPDFALTTPAALKKDQIDVLRQAWVQRYGGVTNSHLPAVLTGGMDVKQLTMKAEDAQLIATRGFQIEDIARIFGVPPFMIGHNEKTTSWGSGVEAMGIGFVKYTLQRHLVKIEQELNRKFWPSRERYFVEFNTAGLERGDYKTRMEGYRVALGRAGEESWLDVNEIRKFENLPPRAEPVAHNDPASHNDPAAPPDPSQDPPAP